MRTGLFFGSFNPMHIGHLAIAQHILNETVIEHIQFIVSPHNPLKSEDSLLPAAKRLEMAQKSVAANPNFSVSDIEFTLETPSYTYKTLEALRRQYPHSEFSIIMGSDTLENLPKWKEVQAILAYPIIVYRRSAILQNPFPGSNISVLDAPLLPVSATAIRQMIRDKKDIRYLVRDEIIDLLKIN